MLFLLFIIASASLFNGIRLDFFVFVVNSSEEVIFILCIYFLPFFVLEKLSQVKLVNSEFRNPVLSKNLKTSIQYFGKALKIFLRSESGMTLTIVVSGMENG